MFYYKDTHMHVFIETLFTMVKNMKSIQMFITDRLVKENVHTWQGSFLPPSCHHIYLAFLPMLSLPIPYCPFPSLPQQTPGFDPPLPVSMCSHYSTPTYEWEHEVFDFLILCQFAENDGFQIHPCPYKTHRLIVFYGYIVFHGVYVPHFPCSVYHQWAFGLVSGLCYCK